MADLRSKCEFLNTSHLLIEGYILEIGHGKTECSITIYLTTKKFQPHRSVNMRTGDKNVRARPFSPFSHTKTDFRDWSWKDKILINRISNHKATSERAHAHRSKKRPRARGLDFCNVGGSFSVSRVRPQVFYIFGILIIR